MSAPYRSPARPSELPISPEDEMRLILARDNSRLGVVISAAVPVVLAGAAMVVEPAGGAWFMTYALAQFAFAVRQWRRPRRLARELRARGHHVP